MLALLPVLQLLSCAEPVPVYRGGTPEGAICADAAPAAGLTVLDLSDDWAPAVFAPGPDGAAPAYRATYLALAQGRLTDAGADGHAATGDRELAAFGIVPTLPTLAARLEDEARHRCHDAVDDVALAAITSDLREESAGGGASRLRASQALRARLEREVARRKLADLDALAAQGGKYARQVERLRAAETRRAAILAAQAHLRCEGELDEAEAPGTLGWRTAAALLVVEKRHVLVPRGRLDADTRALLLEDSRRADHRAALRALRERVIAATGLLEDGSAGAGSEPVLGLALEPAGWSHVVGHAPLAGAAPDLVGRATEAAAVALGWTTPAATARAIRAQPARVAVALPAPPAYHRSHMELSAEIDRGDVWYDPEPRTRTLERRPALILYALVDGERRPLVRWPTTIGGWQHEKVGAGVRHRWKESPVGPRVWRQLFVGPTWLPPATTPDRELVRELRGERYVLHREVLGPSYRSAYGLTMLVHEQVLRRRGVVGYGGDQRVRTHGSGSIASLFDGHSHGCHRLLPPQALRLAGFLLAHREHAWRGEQPTRYHRTVHHHGTFTIDLRTRGTLIELTPPVPVEVLVGRIRSPRKTPP